jgi:hypothetical protein
MKTINVQIGFDSTFQYLLEIDIEDDATEIEIKEQIHEEVWQAVMFGKVVYNVIKEDDDAQ